MHKLSPDQQAQQLLSNRARVLDRFARYVDGTQYDDRAPFLAQSSDTPLLERAPNIVYPIVANAIASNADFVLGEGRWPSFSVEESSLSDDVRDALTQIVGQAIDATHLESVARRALEHAQSVGSSCALLGVRRGRLFVELIAAQWCSPSLNSEGHVHVLEISYPYVDEYYDSTARKYEMRCMVYRRVIDAISDVVYEPIEASLIEHSEWREQSRIDHGLGFCPAVWYKFLCSDTEHSVDGRAIHAHLLDEIDALNFALSQRHRAALYCGDPQIFEVGVDKSQDSGAYGHTARVTTEAGHFAIKEPPRKAKKKGPGTVWSYDDPQAKVGLLTLPGDALKAIDEHARDLKSKIQESLAVVDIDIESARLASDVSGKALEILFRRQTDRCTKIRQDFGAHFLCPVVSMLLRICYKFQGKILLDSISEARTLLSFFDNETDAEIEDAWIDPCIKLSWGPYFRPSDSDTKTAVESVKAALEARTISRRQAVQKLLPHYPAGSASEVLDEIRKTPTIDEALQLEALQLKSPTLARIYRTALALELAGDIEESDRTAIENEIAGSVDTHADLDTLDTEVDNG